MSRRVELGDGGADFTDAEALSFWNSAWRVMRLMPERYVEVECRPAFDPEGGEHPAYIGPGWTFMWVDGAGTEWTTGLVLPFSMMDTTAGLREILACVDASIREAGVLSGG